MADDPNDNPSLPERRFEPASKGDLSTIAIGFEQCQTGNRLVRALAAKFIVPLHLGNRLRCRADILVRGIWGRSRSWSRLCCQRGTPTSTPTATDRSVRRTLAAWTISGLHGAT